MARMIAMRLVIETVRVGARRVASVRPPQADQPRRFDRKGGRKTKGTDHAQKVSHFVHDRAIHLAASIF
jgi:hypothetical protein